MSVGGSLRATLDCRHPAAAGGAVVEVLLGELVAPVAEPEVLDGPRQLALGRRERQHDAGDLQLLAGFPVAVDAVRLSLDDDLAAGRRCPPAITLRHAAAHFTCGS